MPVVQTQQKTSPDLLCKRYCHYRKNSLKVFEGRHPIIRHSHSDSMSTTLIKQILTSVSLRNKVCCSGTLRAPVKQRAPLGALNNNN